MKLYYAPAVCSFAPHVALREAGLPFTLVRYDMKGGLLEDGRALREVNPKGYVPVLELETGERLTEVSAILQYIADMKPESGLAPRQGTLARYRLQEWLNFIATEIHKIFWPLVHPSTEAEVQQAKEKLGRAFSFLEQSLGTSPYLLGEAFTVADAYLLTTLNWTRTAGIDLHPWPKLNAYRKVHRERASVKAALEAEGLLRRAG